jgi:hypothetical protein
MGGNSSTIAPFFPQGEPYEYAGLTSPALWLAIDI